MRRLLWHVAGQCSDVYSSLELVAAYPAQLHRIWELKLHTGSGSSSQKSQDGHSPHSSQRLQCAEAHLHVLTGFPWLSIHHSFIKGNSFSYLSPWNFPALQTPKGSWMAFPGGSKVSQAVFQ